MQSLDHLVTVCDLTPTDFMAELRLVDPDDGVSEWIYRLTGRTVEAEPGGEEEEEEEEEEESEPGIN
jgi:hypothetical protein